MAPANTPRETLMVQPAATWYEFRLVVAGLEFDDEDTVDALLAGFDGEASVGGATTELLEILFTVSGNDPVEVVRATIAKLQRIVPEVVVRSIDQQLVNISDIAAMTGRSRESIRLYADGNRGVGGFPPPVGVVGNGVRVWRWPDVDAWLSERAGYAFPTRPVPSWVIDVINASLDSASSARTSNNAVLKQAVS